MASRWGVWYTGVEEVGAEHNVNVSLEERPFG